MHLLGLNFVIHGGRGIKHPWTIKVLLSKCQSRHTLTWNLHVYLISKKNWVVTWLAFHHLHRKKTKGSWLAEKGITRPNDWALMPDKFQLELGQSNSEGLSPLGQGLMLQRSNHQPLIYCVCLDAINRPRSTLPSMLVLHQDKKSNQRQWESSLCQPYHMWRLVCQLQLCYLRSWSGLTSEVSVDKACGWLPIGTNSQGKLWILHLLMFLYSNWMPLCSKSYWGVGAQYRGK